MVSMDAGDKEVVIVDGSRTAVAVLICVISGGAGT